MTNREISVNTNAISYGLRCTLVSIKRAAHVEVTATWNNCNPLTVTEFAKTYNISQATAIKWLDEIGIT